MLVKIQQIALVALAGFFLFSGLRTQAAWAEPTQSPPLGNVPIPVYSQGTSQTIDGTLHVGTPGSYATGFQGTGLTAGIQGNIVGNGINALFGNLTDTSVVGGRAVYGNAVGADDYALYASGGLGMGIASGDIWFLQRNSAIGFPHTNTNYGSVGALKVMSDGETQIRSLGGGIRFMKVTGVSPGTLTPLVTISEAGNVGIGIAAPLTKLDVRGALIVPSGLGNTAGRPTVGAARIQGEIAGVGGATPAIGWDDGFLRISAGGGGTATVKSFIDLSGYSTVGDMNQNIVLGTAGSERMRITSSAVSFSGNVIVSNDIFMGEDKAIRSDANEERTLVVGNFNGDGGAFTYGGAYNMNVAVEGNVKANGLCIQNDCRTSWAAIGGAQALLQVLQVGSDASSFVGTTQIGGDIHVPSGNVGIGTPSQAAKLQVKPGTGAEGVRVIASNYSPLVVRDTGDANDLLRLNQGGNLTVSGTLNNRLIGTGLGNIAVNAGAGVTNTGLDANYLQGHSWNDVTNLLADAPAQTPERHYFISAATTNGNAGGFSGLDAKCEADANALAGRDYHVYAAVTTGRNFRNGVLYSNKNYGTFAVTGAQDPDLCRVLGITCDPNWLANSSVYVWDTSLASCNTWSGTQGNGKEIYNRLSTALSAGTVSTSGANRACNSQRQLLCIENSGPMSVPGAVCGNGAIESGEYCDDGNTVNDATCPANCQADGGYCGDGYNASDETCDYNNALYAGRNKCSLSCTWLPDLDGDTHSGQNDCWNNDQNAFPGSIYEGTTSKDYNCDGNISSRWECTAGVSDFACGGDPNCPGSLKSPNTTGIYVCPSPNTQTTADQFCAAKFPGLGATSNWRCNGSYNEVGCAWCGASTTYYW